MSFKYRKEKRLKAHLILERLFKSMFDKIKSEEKPITFVDPFTLMDVTEDEFTSFYGSILLLVENGHIKTKKVEHTTFDTILITEKGMEAYHDGFYLVENRKDRIEGIELTTRWVIPLLSAAFAAAAIIISILAYLKK